MTPRRMDTVEDRLDACVKESRRLRKQVADLQARIELRDLDTRLLKQPKLPALETYDPDETVN